MSSKIKIGKVTAAQGLHGELRLFHNSGDEEALRRLTVLFLEEDGAPIAIEKLRMLKRTPIVKLAGIETRETAEALIGTEIFADKEEARPKEEGAYFVSDLVGLQVRVWQGLDAEGGIPYETENDVIGEIFGIIDNPAHDVLEIKTEQGPRLLPFVDVFIREINIAEGFILTTPPDGWLA